MSSWDVNTKYPTLDAEIAQPVASGRSHRFTTVSPHSRLPDPRASSPVIFQKPLHLDCCHASRSRRRNRLPVAPVLHIAACEDTLHLREHIIARLQISIGVGVQLPVEDLGIRNVSNPQ